MRTVNKYEESHLWCAWRSMQIARTWIQVAKRERGTHLARLARSCAMRAARAAELADINREAGR